MSQLSELDSRFLAYLRAIAIFVIVFGHVGGFWIYRPYSELLHVFVAIFFFISGAVNSRSLERLAPMQYISKRLPTLLVPYFLFCILVLIYYCFSSLSFPSFTFENVWRWLSIVPLNSISPFPVGQVWFLHALCLIIIFAPFLYRLILRGTSFLIAYVITLLSLTAIQLRIDIDDYFFFAFHNLYQPLVHSLFFILGAIYIGRSKAISRGWLISIFVVACLLELVLVKGLGFSLDYSEHTYAPDLVYLLGCFSALAGLLAIKDFIVAVLAKSSAAKIALDFFHKHTFAIFLLHSFSIYLVEEFFHLKEHVSSPLGYAGAKLFFVLLITCLAAVPFTWVASRLLNRSTSTPH